MGRFVALVSHVWQLQKIRENQQVHPESLPTMKLILLLKNYSKITRAGHTSIFLINASAAAHKFISQCMAAAKDWGKSAS